MKIYYLFAAILYCLLPSLSEAQWYSSETNNNNIYTDLTAKKAIWALYDSLQHGKSFTTIAFKYSQDPTSYTKGGELAPLVIDKLIKEYQDVVWKLGEGQTSKPFKSEYGYSIIQLLSKEGDKCIIRNILLRTD